jgi:hypothetical protein
MTVRFDPDERAALDRMARRLGVSVAGAIRLLVQGHMSGHFDVVLCSDAEGAGKSGRRAPKRPSGKRGQK